MSGTALLAHRLAGAGEPLLLLNGGLMSIPAWEPVAAPLQADFRVLRCDLRGQLLSPGVPPARVGGHVAELVALLDALALERVHVVGTSFGAFVGLALAAQRPERVASLIAATAAERVTADAWAATRPLLEACREAAAGRDGRRVFDLLAPATFSARYRARHAALLEERARQVGRLPRAWFEGLAGLLCSLEGLDLRPSLGQVRCPVLVLAAGGDATFPLERSEALAAGIPGARLAVVPDAGHGLVVEDPQALLAALRPFLAGVSLARAAPG